MHAVRQLKVKRPIRLAVVCLTALLIPLDVPVASAGGGTFQVSYNSNANQHQPGVVSGSVPATESFASGSTVTVSTNSGSLARQGFTFAGWNTASDGTGTNYAAGTGTFTINSDTTLYAKWNIPSSARLLANSNETSTVVSITNPNSIVNGSSCTSGGVRGITSDGTYVYIRPSGGLGYICKLTMEGVVVSVLNVGANLSALSAGSLDLTYSKGCIFIQPSPNSDSPPDYVGNTTLRCIQVSDSTIHTISLPVGKPLFPGMTWLSGNLIDFPDGRIGAVSRPYTPAEFLISGADTSTITSCPPTNYCKVLRLYTLSGSGKDVVPTWSEDMVIAEGDSWPDDDHGIATDGTYLYQTNFNSGYRVYALRSGALSYTVFNAIATTGGDTGTTCGASTGTSGYLCLINYPVTGSNDSGKVLSNNTYWGRNHTTNQYLNGDYGAARFWVSGSVAPPAGPGSTPAAENGNSQFQNSYCPSISISSISPLGGSAEGGSELTINGSGLTNSVYMNDRIAPVLLSYSSKVIISTLAGTKGEATIRVDGCSGSARITYLYDPDPVISSLSSNKISTSGGTITITGAFLSRATISIGTTKATISSNSDTSIVAELPALTAGDKTMTLTTAFGTTTSKLTYLEPPSLNTALTFPYIAQGDLVSLSFSATGADSYISSKSLPPGLNLETSNGLLSGIANKEGIYEFSITAKNEVGSDTKHYTLEVDRPTPKSLNANIYFSYKSTSLSASNKISLDRFIAKLKSVAPRRLGSTITINGGLEKEIDNTSATRDLRITEYLEASGIKVLNYLSKNGDKNKFQITANWIR